METIHRLALPDGASLAYRVAYAGPMPPPDPARAVLLLHGLASNLTRYSELVERTRLTQQWRVLRIDLRGHGDSATRARVRLETWCADLLALLNAERIQQAIIVGHSLGAQVAMHFAQRYPARVAGLALIDPVYRDALHGRWQLLGRFGPLFTGASMLVRALNALGLRRRTVPKLDLRALDAMARQALQSKEAEQAFVRRYSSTRADLRTFRTAQYLQELVEMFRRVPDPATLNMPVLVLLSLGATFADSHATRAIAARYPQGRIVTIDCHHWPLTERPDEVRTAIERWCDELRARIQSGNSERELGART